MQSSDPKAAGYNQVDSVTSILDGEIFKSTPKMGGFRMYTQAWLLQGTV